MPLRIVSLEHMFWIGDRARAIRDGVPPPHKKLSLKYSMPQSYAAVSVHCCWHTHVHVSYVIAHGMGMGVGRVV